jgi:hypothetical protein
VLPIVQLDHVILDVGSANARMTLDAHVVSQSKHHFLDLKTQKIKKTQKIPHPTHA